MPRVRIPYRFEPRSYQIPMLQAFDAGARRIVQCDHRRSGKDKLCLNICAMASVDRVGTYYHLFPTYGQAKRTIWDGLDKEGMPFLDHFPREYVSKKLEDDMRVEFTNGSSYQLVGTENIDRLMGSNPLGVVFSEYSLQNPSSWDFMRPILRENGGWAIFNFTPRGNNHAKVLYDLAMERVQAGDPEWYCQRLSIKDTGVLTEADMDIERRDGMSEEMIQQEYYVSFEGVREGAIFGKQLDLADKEGRICAVPWQPEYAVDTWWDIGSGDPTAIWFTQNVGREIHVIDYYENSGVGVGIDFYIKHLQTLPYVWGKHNGPHDMEAHEFAAGGKSAKEVAKQLGFDFNVIPRTDNKTDSINAGRLIMARCWFDRKKTDRGRDALASYHYAWDDKRKVFQDKPYHDWSSNGSDAWQQLGMGHKTAAPKRERVQSTSVSGRGSWQAN